MATVFPVARLSLAWSVNVEWLKWAGLFFMLLDHYEIYVLGGALPAFQVIGSLAFPCFAVALAAGVARTNRLVLWSVVQKLLLWGAVAQAALIGFAIRDPYPLNILFTFAFGLSAHLLYRENKQSLLLVFVMLALGCFVEFLSYGVLFVFLLCEMFRDNSLRLSAFPLLLLATFAPFNEGIHAAFLAVPVIALLSFLPRDLPRLKGVFYPLYSLQFLIFWVLTI